MSRLLVEPLTDDERFRLGLVLKNSTPAERIGWLEDLRLAFGVEHLKKVRDMRFKVQDAENPLNFPPAHDR